MRRVLHIASFVLLLSVFSCAREPFLPSGNDLPEGVPALVTIPFGAEAMTEVSVGTKADAGLVNESHIHDIYVLLFDKGDLSTGSPRKIYGRYFNFEHRRSSLSELNSRKNECWYVENKDLEGGITRTRGAVKISTVTCSDVVVVLLANVDNAVTELDDQDQIARLNAISDLEELRGLSVKLEQDVVNRKNLFLMMGTLGYNDGRRISTGSMHWNRPAPNNLDYDPDYKVQLRMLNGETVPTKSAVDAVTPDPLASFTSDGGFIKADVPNSSAAAYNYNVFRLDLHASLHGGNTMVLPKDSEPNNVVLDDVVFVFNVEADMDG